jgi:hypothetical protein
LLYLVQFGMGVYGSPYCVTRFRLLESSVVFVRRFTHTA